MTESERPGGATEKTYWLDDRRNVDRLIYTLLLVGALLFGADFYYHKHVYFPIENRFGFYAWYGFICCVSLVLIAKQLRKVLRRNEDYYGD